MSDREELDEKNRQEEAKSELAHRPRLRELKIYKHSSVKYGADGRNRVDCDGMMEVIEAFGRQATDGGHFDYAFAAARCSDCDQLVVLENPLHRFVAKAGYQQGPDAPDYRQAKKKQSAGMPF